MEVIAHNSDIEKDKEERTSNIPKRKNSLDDLDIDGINLDDNLDPVVILLF